MKTHLSYLAVIAILFIVIGFNRCGDENVKVTERTTIDSTKVDSLTKVIQELESLPPETTYVTVEIPSEPDTVYEDSDGTTLRRFTTIHTDSVISAMWTTTTTGHLRGQNFNYSLHHRPVLRETVTKYVTKYRTTERTIEKQAGGFLAVGGDIGHSTLTNSIGSLKIRYQAKDGYSYGYRYDPLIDGHYIGITIPIRIKIPFL